jgi:two-component system LytT family response regulator
MTIRAIIVDDEPLAREGLRLQLANEPDITLIGEYDTGTAAIKAINQDKPDLVFLDIQMPVVNGFDVVKKIDPAHIPMIVFITAYDRYALHAFEVHALDYLLKPIDDQRLHKSLQRVRTLFEQHRLTEFAARLNGLLAEVGAITPDNASISSVTNRCISTPLQRIAVKSGNSIQFIQVHDIQWIQAAGDYVYVHSNGQKHLIRETLTYFADNLPPRQFQRIHRSAIVNLDAIRELHCCEHGEYIVHLHDKTKLRLSRTYREKLQAAIGYLP